MQNVVHNHAITITQNILITNQIFTMRILEWLLDNTSEISIYAVNKEKEEDFQQNNLLSDIILMKLKTFKLLFGSSPMILIWKTLLTMLWITFGSKTTFLKNSLVIKILEKLVLDVQYLTLEAMTKTHSFA